MSRQFRHAQSLSWLIGTLGFFFRWYPVCAVVFIVGFCGCWWSAGVCTCMWCCVQFVIDVCGLSTDEVGPNWGYYNRLVGTRLSYPLLHPLTPPPFWWPYIRLSKLWLLGNYSEVPTSSYANPCLHIPLMYVCPANYSCTNLVYMYKPVFLH